MLNIKEELKKVCEETDAVLREDPYPGRVRPEELREAVRNYPMRGGKRLRPALVFWCAAACGGSPEKARYAAAAVEVFHNWTLVHDDIIDRDEFRRGVPTEHMILKKYAEEHLRGDAAQFGTDLAILAGDIQQAWAASLLLRSTEAGADPAVVVKLAERMHAVLNPDLVSGEALDVEFEYRKELPSPDEVRTMILGKTSALLSYSAFAGSAIGCGSVTGKPELFARFGSALGTAFQIQDDLLGIYGESRTFGKPIGSDIREGKPTLLFLDACSSLSPSGREKLLSFRGREDLTEAEIGTIRTLLEECGARARAEKEAEEAENCALAALEQAGDNEYIALLRDLVRYLTHRTV